MSTVELRFAALPGHVRTARRIAMAVARRAGVPTGVLDEIGIAVGEACLRAVNVNRRRAPESLVEIRMTGVDGAFTVAVADSGEPGDDVAPGPDGGLLGAPALLDLSTGDARPAGDPLTALPGDQEPGAAGSALPPGIGLALIEGLVDDVQIRRRPDGVGTVVTMTWDTATFIGGGLEGGMATAGNPAL
ncbi:ATP-binding protein [Pseudofrankia asymbiotica]|nr:ATP-binding protein [Pseudofrankia asymbiotica]